MNINILLEASQLTRVSSLVFDTEEEITLSFSSKIYPTSCLCGIAECGKQVKRFVYRGAPINISEICHAGELKISVSLVKDNETLKTWIVEPYVIKENPATIEAIPIIEDLKNEISVIKKAVLELYSQTNSSETI